MPANPTTVNIIAAPFDGGQARSGTDLGPTALLTNGLVNQLQQLGWKVKVDEMKFVLPPKEKDPPHGIVKNPRSVSSVCKQVSEHVSKALKNQHVALTIGGDHSLAIGTINGSLNVFGEDFCVIWVDAHADLNTMETTTSGNLHGMPVSFLLGLEGNSPLPDGEWFDSLANKSLPRLRKDRIVYIGLRDVDAGEKLLLRKHNIKAFSMYDVDKHGINTVIQMALDHVNPHRGLPIHLSFDVDSLDPSVAPSTGTPVRGGLTFREGHFICEEMWKTGMLTALDLMEVNPSLGASEAQKKQTIDIGCSLITSALGETLL